MTRLLVIGHAYVVPANRGKLDALAREPGLAVGLVAPTRWPEPEFGERVLDARGAAYPVYGVPMRRAGHVRRSWFDGARLAAALDEFRPDVVQVEQEPASVAAFQCVRAARKRGARVVLFAWDNVPGANRFPLEWAARHACRRASRVLAGNAGALARLASRGFGAKSEVLPQIGVDVGRFAEADGNAARARLGVSGFVVGFAGRLLARKGVHDLLGAFAAIGGDATLVYVGDGPEAGPLRARADALGVGARVRFVSGVPRDAMPERLAALSVLVLPSRTTPGWAEQFGHVLVEAMAAGVPVIGSDSGAIPEVIGDAGLVFREGDARALAGLLEQLRDDEAARGDLGRRGRARARERFSDATIARRTAEVAREARRGAPPIDPRGVRRVLVVKPDHLGDMALAVPALSRLRRLVPDARIDVLGREGVHAFTLAHGLADRVVPFDSPWLDRTVPRVRDWPRLVALVARLRRERYDLAVNLRHDVRDILLTALTGARWTASYDHRGAARWITHSPGAPDPLGHETARWNALVDALGAPPDAGFAPRVADAARDAARRAVAALPAGRPRVALHAVSRRASKRWPEASWRALVAEITEALGAAVVLVGGAEDRAAHAPLLGPNVADAAGAIALPDLPALLAECRAFVGVDSGPAHLAALVGLPTVVLFSGVDLPERWAPAGARVTVLRREVPCRPCRSRECGVPGHPCLTAIGVAEVAGAVREALR